MRATDLAESCRGAACRSRQRTCSQCHFNDSLFIAPMQRRAGLSSPIQRMTLSLQIHTTSEVAYEIRIRCRRRRNDGQARSAQRGGRASGKVGASHCARKTAARTSCRTSRGACRTAWPAADFRGTTASASASACRAGGRLRHGQPLREPELGRIQPARCPRHFDGPARARRERRELCCPRRILDGRRLRLPVRHLRHAGNGHRRRCHRRRPPAHGRARRRR